MPGKTGKTPNTTPRKLAEAPFQMPQHGYRLRVMKPEWGLPNSIPRWRGRGLFDFVDIIQNAARHADGENRQVSLRLVLDAARHVDHDSLVQLDFLVVEDHGALAVDDVIEFVGALV